MPEEQKSGNHAVSVENTSSADELLKLDNQLCFALYVGSKETIRKYKSLLEPLHLTYTGYITMMALWEKDDITVKELGERLTLDSGTLTPLLKKLESVGYIVRIRSSEDERSVYVRLTHAGHALKNEAANVPKQLICSLHMEPQQALQLRNMLHVFIRSLSIKG